MQRQRTFTSRSQTDPITGNKLSHPITFDTVVAATRFPSHSHGSHHGYFFFANYHAEGTGTEARKAGTDMYVFYLSKNERREDGIVSKINVITIKNNPPNKNHKK